MDVSEREGENEITRTTKRKTDEMRGRAAAAALGGAENEKGWMDDHLSRPAAPNVFLRSTPPNPSVPHSYIPPPLPMSASHIPHVHSSTHFHLHTETAILDALYTRSRHQHRAQLFLRHTAHVLRLCKPTLAAWTALGTLHHHQPQPHSPHSLPHQQPHPHLSPSDAGSSPLPALLHKVGGPPPARALASCIAVVVT